MKKAIETHNQNVIEQVFISLGRHTVFLDEFVDKVMISIRDKDVSTWRLEALRGRNVVMMKQSVKRLIKRSTTLALVCKKTGVVVQRVAA